MRSVSLWIAASATLELAAGEAVRRGLVPGERLTLG
jgi:hypothetical protein